MKTVEEQIKERTTQELVSSLKGKEIYSADMGKSLEQRLGTLEQIKSSFVDDGYEIVGIKRISDISMEMTIEDIFDQYCVELVKQEACDQCWPEFLPNET